MNATPPNEFLTGVRAEAPILLGVAPFGMIYGALAIAAGLPHDAAQAMSAIVFAGSAQFIATQLIATGTPPVVILLTTLVVNLRHILYSASVAPYLQPLPRRWKALLAYLLTDEAYVVAIARFQEGDAGAGKHRYLLGAGLALWITWQLSTAAGIFLGSQVPPTWSLDFTLPLTFIALLIPTVSDRPALAAALAAGAVAVIGAGWPYKTGLLAAALTGIAVGVWADARKNASRQFGDILQANTNRARWLHPQREHPERSSGVSLRSRRMRAYIEQSCFRVAASFDFVRHTTPDSAQDASPDKTDEA
jgi:4-azaleucine resistance transporter AzlC